ncbi:MAG: DUF2062 domain-containing protein [Parvibaculum sp.]|nr:DUF2062 domain-containing protein [Parvibaculum sp.]MBO6680194.1 DUF2062 domain-containing protein [Parvibaculum sp.]MBO6685502.1 DUF2062 domain-containing protein [Parvibaculum sp.]MBO6903503.1 DUF2062 domain-containing protein [Parvibaculum sp.]
MFWPRSGWKRAFQYGWRRVWRLSGTPHAIALGVAAGAFSSCTPFLGFHILVAMLIAWVIRGNLIASALGTFIGNPITFPVIWLAVFEVGRYIVGAPAGSDPNIAHAMQQAGAFDRILPSLVPLAVGSVPVGIVLGCVFYVLTRSGVEAYQSQRRKLLAERAKARLQTTGPQRASDVNHAAGMELEKGDVT